MPLRKSLRRKDICLKRFLLQTKVPYSGMGRGDSQRIFISVKKRERGRKRRKPTPGFKRGRDWLTPLFCANAVGFMVQTALLYKASNF